MKREILDFIPVREDEVVAGDRRCAPRAHCEYKVEWFDPGTRLSNRGTVLDISESGMRVKTFGPFQFGEVEKLRFYVFTAESMLKLPGAIVRIITDNEFGVRFTFTGATLRECVKEEVESSAHKNLRFEPRSWNYDVPMPRSRGNTHAKAKTLMIGGNTLHESHAAIRTADRSHLSKWLGKRRATHLES